MTGKQKKYLKIAGKAAMWAAIAGMFIVGIFVLWTTTIDLPNLNSFEERKVSQSTKIYDRTGEVVLYDVYGDIKRTVVPLSKISPFLQKAAVAVEDKNFYTHGGIEISSIIRAIRNNLQQGDLLSGQGGSTITQQVIKNALLTREKTISRKLKEWVLAPRLEKLLTKDQILEIYLNEIPYGGSVYGIEEASRRFYNKSAADLTLAESAYLAALPQAPSYYSPYGANLPQLEARKNHVLDSMAEAGFITSEERDEAKKTVVTFQKPEQYGIKAPHFVMYIIEQLEKEYGQDVVENGGLRVITTLDWELQQKAEEIVKRRAAENVVKANAENGAMVAMDPKTGDITVMVGSRDYFDKEIDGNFNIATAKRQPGSTFKPFVYAEAFNKGYRPETVVFDAPTEFSASCSRGGDCYTPRNYDGSFAGPISLRNALAQSRNIPAIKVLYLAGINDALNLAKRMGIESLQDAEHYGLTLVLGGGEVNLLDMANAYSVFATEGMKYQKRSILKVEDSRGEILFEANNLVGERVLSEQTARLISDVLTDNAARTPIFGANSHLYFGGRDVAVKTGTTNDYRDAWVVGYTPSMTVAAWAGNNDNSSMNSYSSSMIAAPMWNEFMQIILKKIPNETFNEPAPINKDIKPILAGYWKGETTSVNEDGDIEITNGRDIHDILHWVETTDPLGPAPRNPANDPQYKLWEDGVKKWLSTQNISTLTSGNTQNETTVIQDRLKITTLENGKDYFVDEIMVVSVSLNDYRKIKSGEVYINDVKIGNLEIAGNSLSFYPSEVAAISSKNNLRVEVIDINDQKFAAELKFGIK
jgi:1A family penicillin-binding protein